MRPPEAGLSSLIRNPRLLPLKLFSCFLLHLEANIAPDSFDAACCIP
jgi:hypothetical protein